MKPSHNSASTTEKWSTVLSAAERSNKIQMKTDHRFEKYGGHWESQYKVSVQLWEQNLIRVCLEDNEMWKIWETKCRQHFWMEVCCIYYHRKGVRSGKL